MSETDQSQNEFQEVRRRRPRPNRKEVLDAVASGDIKPEDAEKMLRTQYSPRFVVTRTGAIAIYNLQRYPIILYPDQWEKLSSLIERGILKNFMKKNASIIRRHHSPQHPNDEQQ